MTLSYTYDGAPLGYDVKPTGINLPTRADNGEAGMGGVPIEDPYGTAVIVGHRPFLVSETLCSQPLLWTGWTQERGIGRSPERGLLAGEDARIHDMTVVEHNACLGFLKITAADGKRPAETWKTRLDWIVASDYLSPFVADLGLVASAAVLDPFYWGRPMDAADYVGQVPTAVLDDLAQRLEGFYFVYHTYWSVADAAMGLFFNPDTESIGDSTLSISNDLADLSATCFAPDNVARLAREPDQVYSEVEVVYSHGTKRLFRSRASTAATYTQRGTTIERPFTGGVSTASKQAEAFLDRHAVELDRITCTITVPAASAGLVRAGQHMDVRFTHLGEPYATGTTMRVVGVTPTPTDDTATYYELALELVALWTVAPATLNTCSMSITTTQDAVSDGHNPGEASGTITIADDGTKLLLAWVISANGNTPGVTNMTEIDDYTTLVNMVPNASKASYTIASRQIDTAGAYTAAATYSSGWGDDGAWIAGHIAIDTEATAPVQDVSVAESDSAVLTTAPTVGNMIIMFAHSEPGGPGGANVPDHGAWTTLFEANTDAYITWPSPVFNYSGILNIGIYARCVSAEDLTDPLLEPDGRHYSFTRAGGYAQACSIYVSEWAITGTGGAADTEVELPPTPGSVIESTSDPTVDDDSDDGYQVGQVWVNTSSGYTYILVDSTVGAAVWTLITTGSSTSFAVSDGVTTVDPTVQVTFVGPTLADLGSGVAELTFDYAPSDVDYLVGTSSSGLSAEIVVGATPGGELGGTWASPTVDATHAGSTHLALGSTSSTAAAGDHVHAATGGGELLITDTPAGSPLIFDDILQNEAGTDLLYSE